MENICRYWMLMNRKCRTITWNIHLYAVLLSWWHTEQFWNSEFQWNAHTHLVPVNFTINLKIIMGHAYSTQIMQKSTTTKNVLHTYTHSFGVVLVVVVCIANRAELHAFIVLDHNSPANGISVTFSYKLSVCVCMCGVDDIFTFAGCWVQSVWKLLTWSTEAIEWESKRGTNWRYGEQVFSHNHRKHSFWPINNLFFFIIMNITHFYWWNGTRPSGSAISF